MFQIIFIRKSRCLVQFVFAFPQQSIAEHQRSPLVTINEPVVGGKPMHEDGSLLMDCPIVTRVWASNGSLDSTDIKNAIAPTRFF